MKQALGPLFLCLMSGPLAAQPNRTVDQGEQASSACLEQHVRQMEDVMGRVQAAQDPVERQRLIQQGMMMERQALENCPDIDQQHTAMMLMMLNHMQQQEAMAGPGSRGGGMDGGGRGPVGPPGGR